ncbi:MAG: prephenate dehydratase [Actinobacteria bacterium]|uniref:prephenate dehydratase n=1 Tax=freshwater metagenome TaxID=449393 RepID=A0A6J5ZPJ6_9ZZZZ|nr:prephenate dehydratase [Actinomycetota bacterium]
MTRIGYLGPKGTFSEQAMLESLAIANAGQSPTPVELPTVHEVVSAVQSGEVDRAIAPVENSVEGGINQVIDALVHDAPDVHIIGEYVLPIDHSLIARDALEPAEITAVVSHPQALAQCASFLRRELPNARLIPSTSTAEAVQTVLASSEPIAAIAGSAAAAQEGAVTIKPSIADHESLETRFIWLSREPAGPPNDGAAGKSAILFSGAGDGSPGWLLDCLSEFASRGVNLTRIESRPERLQLGRYLFLADIEGRVDVPGPAADAVSGLEAHCQQVRVLGSYPV